MIYQILTASHVGTTSSAFIYDNKATAISGLATLMLIILAIGCFAFKVGVADDNNIKKYTILSISLILLLLLYIISLSAILLFFTENMDALIKVLSNSNFIAALIGSLVALIGSFVVFYCDDGGKRNLFAAYTQGNKLKGRIKKILLYILIILASFINSIAIYSSSLLDPTWYFSLIAFVIAAVIIVGGIWICIALVPRAFSRHEGMGDMDTINLENITDALNTKQDTLNTKQDTLNTQKEELKSKKEELDNKNEELKSKKGELDTKKEALQKAEDNSEDNSKEKATLKNEILVINTAITTLNDKIDAIKSAMLKLSGEITILDGEITQLNGEIKSMKKLGGDFNVLESEPNVVPPNVAPQEIEEDVKNKKDENEE